MKSYWPISKDVRLLPLALTAILLMLILNWVGAPLITTAAPLGIISFELGRQPEASNAILASWDGRAQRHAAFSLGLDYLFMLAYAAAISVACLKAGNLLHVSGWPLSGLAFPLAVGVWLAALLDAIENLGLTVILLSGTAVGLWPGIAWACALVKFAIIFVGLVYIFYAGAAYMASRLPERAKNRL